MNIKKFAGTLLLSVVTLLIPFSSAFAAAGWQYLGFDVFHKNSDGNYTSKVHTSDGGDFKVCVTTFDDTVLFKLYEYDPGDNNDDFIGSVYLGNGGCKTFKVGAFADGDNKKPEVYLSAGKYKYAGADMWD